MLLIGFLFRLTHRLIDWSKIRNQAFSIAGESNRHYGLSMAFRVIVSEAVCADVGAACLSKPFPCSISSYACV